MQTAPFGAWNSPVTSESLVKDTVQFYEAASCGEDFFWIELLPSEKGRFRLAWRNSKNEIVDLAPEMSVRTRIHEYGGGALTAHQGAIYFINDRDGRIYRLEVGRPPVAITSPGKLRFADLSVGECIYAVCEEKTDQEDINKIVRIEKDGSVIDVAKGHDFYSAPRVSPNQKQLAWVSWDHPNMPWDGSLLWTATITSVGIQDSMLVAGGKSESICYPRWSPQGDLYFFSDKTGFWNLYRLKKGKVEELFPLDAEFTFPPWVLGRGNYEFLKDGKVLCVYSRNCVDHLAVLDPEKKTLSEIELPFTVIKQVCVAGKSVYFFGASPTLALSLIQMELSSKKWKVLKQSVGVQLEEDWVSVPTPITIQTRHHDTSYGFYYPPKNPNFCAPKGEAAPVILKCHGGPTGHVQPMLSLEIAFWTSRGFGFFDVNYSGSSGYGKAYRERLKGTWGVREVEDCIDGSNTLVKLGFADPKRLLIRGGSAGGYTALCALAFHNQFAAATSYYGVSDLELLVKDTHKFEKYYLTGLIGPYPEQKELYHERSPIYHVDGIKKPLLLLQGDKDPVVPLNQSVDIYEKLKKRNVPVALKVFEGEQHGFKGAEAIKRALEIELFFYAQILGIKLPERIEPIPIENFR
jgi:dipeptidyl aminopeptidase/acylaminoacyl peptidase